VPSAAKALAGPPFSRRSDERDPDRGRHGDPRHDGGGASYGELGVFAKPPAGTLVIRRGLVANGDPRNIATFSNIPHFFLKAGLEKGLLHSGVILRPEELGTRRFLWNSLRPLTLDRPRGWTYSQRYARTVWARRESAEVDEYISHFQLLPPRNEVREPITYYIDATMRQWFEDYGWRVGRRVKLDALAREREAYLSSRFVVCMSDWCAEDVISSYGVPPEQVRTILPGANLDEDSLPPGTEWNGEFSPLRLGLVGIDWERKGGPVLLDAASILERMGHDVEVVVVGPDPSRIRAHPSVKALGYVQKGRDFQRFVEILRSFHFGCLLSRVEASGLSTLEYLRLGVPIITTAVGGVVDPRGAGLRFPVGADGEQVAEALVEVLREPERYAAMRKAAARDGMTYRWARTADEMLTVLNGSTPHA
jgi:glycosyltransferase involved in cell wall biosynthesis